MKNLHHLLSLSAILGNIFCIMVAAQEPDASSITIPTIPMPSLLRIENVPPFYVIGSPMPLYVNYTHKGDSAVFNVGTNGLPDQKQIAVTSEAGIAVERRQFSWPYGAPVGPRPDLTNGYAFKSASNIRLCYDLSDWFVFKQGGKYKFRIFTNQSTIAEVELVLLKLNPVSKLNYKANCLWPGFHSFYAAPSLPVESNLSIGRATFKGKELWFATVEASIFYGEIIDVRNPWPLECPALSVTAGTKIEKAELDYAANLWCILEVEGRRKLVAWNLYNRNLRTVIDWTPAAIEMGVTEVLPGMINSKIVIAGIDGQTKISTLSYGVETQQAMQDK